jgi:hypothetical protein
MESGRLRLEISKDDSNVGYLYLPTFPVKSEGCVAKLISLHELIKNYKGIPIYLDFDKNDNLVGIEIIG